MSPDQTRTVRAAITERNRTALTAARASAGVRLHVLPPAPPRRKTFSTKLLLITASFCAGFVLGILFR